MRDFGGRLMYQLAARHARSGLAGAPTVAGPTKRPRARRKPRPAGTGPTDPGPTTPDPRRWYALALLCVASFLVILDASIVIVATPSIQHDLHLDTSSAQWVLTAYELAFGGLLLLGGRSADLYGRRRVFMLGIALFVLTSLLCGLAPNGEILIVARAVQGISAAIMAPSAFSILVTTFPEGPERNKAIGTSGAVAALGGTAGSLLGGPVTELLGWQWIFLLNIPLGLAMLAASPLLLRESRTNPRHRTLDPAGAGTVTAALVLFVDAIAEGPQAGWTALRTLGLLTASAVLAVLFILIERRSTNPLVPLRTFRSRTLVGGNLVTLTAAMTAYGQSFILTQYAQQVLGYSAIRFGLLNAIVPVTAVIGSFAGPRFLTRTGARTVAVTSTALLAAACVLLTQISPTGNLNTLVAALLIFGPGLGAGTVAASIAAVTNVPAADSGLAAGLNNTAFQLGGALGISTLTTIATPHPTPTPATLTTGYQHAFAAAATSAVIGLLAALLLLEQRCHRPPPTQILSPSPECAQSCTGPAITREVIAATPQSQNHQPHA